MLRLFQKTLLVLAIAGLSERAAAFSLMGPYEGYQIPRIGYNLTGPAFGDDIGGVMNLGEEYRWNIRTITFGFDSAFKNYFGQRGVEEVREAMDILNSLPQMSKLSPTLSEFQTDTRRVNFRASALGLLDLKSYALAAVIEQMGLTSPDRYTWTLRARIETPPPIEYHVIKRNFDPVTLQPSSYVNGTLYTYIVRELPVTPPVADALELPVDPLAFQFTAVASALSGQFGGFLIYGDFLTGLTRDDVGGLRYLYSGKGTYVNRNIEGLLPDVVTNAFGGGSGGSPWAPISGTAPVNVALRPGIDKILFKEVKYDSELGFFVPTTNSFKDVYITNSTQRTQTYQRGLQTPDILFSASDQDLSVLTRTDTTGWLNNAVTNAPQQPTVLGGPGVIAPPIVISFNKVGPLFGNFDADFLDEQTAIFNFVWGSFDGTTNEPVVYPIGTSIAELEALVLRGGR